MILKVPNGQDPYTVIGQYIRDHITAIEDIIATIELDGIRTNELFMVNMQEDGFFVWQSDWYEGEQNIALIDFFPVSDAKPERENEPVGCDRCKIVKALEQEPCEDAISRQAALQCCRNEWEEEVEIRLKSLPPVTSQQKYEDIAKAFQLGLAFGFGTKHDEMDRVINEIKKVICSEADKEKGEVEE